MPPKSSRKRKEKSSEKRVGEGESDVVLSGEVRGASSSGSAIKKMASGSRATSSKFGLKDPKLKESIGINATDEDGNGTCTELTGYNMELVEDEHGVLTMRTCSLGCCYECFCRSSSSDDESSDDEEFQVDDEKERCKKNKRRRQSVALQKEKRDSAKIPKRKENKNGRRNKKAISNKNDANINPNKGSGGVPSASITLLKGQEKSGDFTEIIKRKENGKERGSENECLKENGKERRVAPLQCSWFKAKEPPVEKSEEEKMLDRLWEEMELALASEKIGSMVLGKGKEHVDATCKVDRRRISKKNKNGIRMLKLYSWLKEKSILGVSYNLFEKLAGEESKADMKTAGKQKRNTKKKMKEPESRKMGKLLREIPDLLVLDEGHTPRNQNSLIWKALSKIQTQKRIILSGTPFQNTFQELYNTLCLAKPTFPDTIPPELKKFCLQEKKAPILLSSKPYSSSNTVGDRVDEKIKQLKLLMDPFVHVHKRSFLQKNLLGLREYVVTLKPINLQRALLQKIECSKGTFGFDRKLALVSIHPSLLLCCPHSEKEEYVVDMGQLKELKLNPYEGVKTRFLVEFVRLCDAMNEKVLVFSQYLDPLCLVRDQLKSILDWSNGKEVLYMDGKLTQNRRQSLVHYFNDSDSKAKIMLASTNACSKGINLTEASRVVLLDVLWNPSKEKQAISRAYRLGQKKVVYTYHLITQESWQKYHTQQGKVISSEKLFSDKNTENDQQQGSAGGVRR
ncbi:hypothetical protein RIF29_29691 [Crotalaria pallida]|uniref:Uncharacterized protein n=1 Tax=Crotalaria pallida TaxID=3830 RepID=A0AAN9HW47_CROPI